MGLSLFYLNFKRKKLHIIQLGKMLAVEVRGPLQIRTFLNFFFLFFFGVVCIIITFSFRILDFVRREILT